MTENELSIDRNHTSCQWEANFVVTWLFDPKFDVKCESGIFLVSFKCNQRIVFYRYDHDGLNIIILHYNFVLQYSQFQNSSYIGFSSLYFQCNQSIFRSWASWTIIGKPKHSLVTIAKNTTLWEAEASQSRGFGKSPIIIIYPICIGLVG